MYRIWKEWKGVKIVAPQHILNEIPKIDKIIIGSHYYYDEIKNNLTEMGLSENTDFVYFKSMPND